MMELLFNMKCSCVWMLWCCLMFVKGESLCKSELLKSFNISTELQSDVLLPCDFNPALLGSDKTADIAVIWSQMNTTAQNLLEIPLQGQPRFWDNKGGRVKTFPELSESGNFSIVLQKVQLYDLSLYRCELFNGSSCSIAYQEIQLGLATVLYPTLIITGALTGVLLCLLVACVFYLGKKRRQLPHPESPRGCPYDNPIYASYTAQHSQDRDASHSENPVYENVWNRAGRMQ